MRKEGRHAESLSWDKSSSSMKLAMECLVLRPFGLCRNLGSSARGEVRGVNGEECSEWVAWSEGSDGQDLQYTAVGFVNFVSEGDAVS